MQRTSPIAVLISVALTACTAKPATTGDAPESGGGGGPGGRAGAAVMAGRDGGSRDMSGDEAGGVGGETPPRASGSWWDPAWPWRRPVTVDLPGAAALKDLPVLIAIARTSLDGHGEASLRFVSMAGDLLPHELDTITAEHIFCWVRVPDPATPFWLYYGHAEAPALPARHGEQVWGADAVVFHLEDGTESGPGGYDLETEADSFAPGRIGRGFLGASAKRTSLALPRVGGAGEGMLAGASALTLSAWVKPTDFSLLGDKPFARQVLAVGTTKDDSNYNHAAAFLGLGLRNGGSFGGEVVVGARPTGDEETARSGKAVPLGAWSHIAAIVDVAGKRARLFIDGESVSDWISMGDLEATAFAPDHEAKSAHIGASAGGGYGFFDGGIDEVRLERTLRDETWIRAVYENMRDPHGTIAFGSPQPQP